MTGGLVTRGLLSAENVKARVENIIEVRAVRRFDGLAVGANVPVPLVPADDCNCHLDFDVVTKMGSGARRMCGDAYVISTISSLMPLAAPLTA